MLAVLRRHADTVPRKVALPLVVQSRHEMFLLFFLKLHANGLGTG